MNSDSGAPATVEALKIGPTGAQVHVCRWRPVVAGAVSPGAAPILMQHDSLGCVDLWRDLPSALALATGREVIAYDRLGFGRSDARSARPGRDFVAEEIDHRLPALLAALGVDRFVAFGHSVGGGMSVHAAADRGRPWHCEALVTIAAQAFVEDRTLEGIRAAEQGFKAPGQIERLARYHGDKAAWVLDAWIGNWLDPAFAAWTLDAVLPEVSCPALIIHGGEDEYGSRAHPLRIAAGVAGPVETVILEGLGHMPHREAPERVLARVQDFLAAGPGG